MKKLAGYKKIGSSFISKYILGLFFSLCFSAQAQAQSWQPTCRTYGPEKYSFIVTCSIPPAAVKRPYAVLLGQGYSNMSALHCSARRADGVGSAIVRLVPAHPTMSMQIQRAEPGVTYSVQCTPVDPEGNFITAGAVSFTGVAQGTFEQEILQRANNGLGGVIITADEAEGPNKNLYPISKVSIQSYRPGTSAPNRSPDFATREANPPGGKLHGMGNSVAIMKDQEHGHWVVDGQGTLNMMINRPFNPQIGTHELTFMADIGPVIRAAWYIGFVGDRGTRESGKNISFSPDGKADTSKPANIGQVPFISVGFSGSSAVLRVFASDGALLGVKDCPTGRGDKVTANARMRHTLRLTSGSSGRLALLQDTDFTGTMREICAIDNLNTQPLGSALFAYISAASYNQFKQPWITGIDAFGNEVWQQGSMTLHAGSIALLGPAVSSSSSGFGFDVPSTNVLESFEPSLTNKALIPSVGLDIPSVNNTVSGTINIPYSVRTNPGSVTGTYAPIQTVIINAINQRGEKQIIYRKDFPNGTLDYLGQASFDSRNIPDGYYVFEVEGITIYGAKASSTLGTGAYEKYSDMNQFFAVINEAPASNQAPTLVSLRIDNLTAGFSYIVPLNAASELKVKNLDQLRIIPVIQAKSADRIVKGTGLKVHNTDPNRRSYEEEWPDEWVEMSIPSTTMVRNQQGNQFELVINHTVKNESWYPNWRRSNDSDGMEWKLRILTNSGQAYSIDSPHIIVLAGDTRTPGQSLLPPPSTPLPTVTPSPTPTATRTTIAQPTATMTSAPTSIPTNTAQPTRTISPTQTPKRGTPVPTRTKTPTNNGFDLNKATCAHFEHTVGSRSQLLIKSNGKLDASVQVFSEQGILTKKTVKTSASGVTTTSVIIVGKNIQSQGGLDGSNRYVACILPTKPLRATFSASITTIDAAKKKEKVQLKRMIKPNKEYKKKLLNSEKIGIVAVSENSESDVHFKFQVSSNTQAIVSSGVQILEDQKLYFPDITVSNDQLIAQKVVLSSDAYLYAFKFKE